MLRHASNEIDAVDSGFARRQEGGHAVFAVSGGTGFESNVVRCRLGAGKTPDHGVIRPFGMPKEAASSVIGDFTVAKCGCHSVNGRFAFPGSEPGTVKPISVSRKWIDHFKKTGT
jgi:hypothetical protein